MGYRTLQQNYARLAYFGLPLDDVDKMSSISNAKAKRSALMDLNYDFICESEHETYICAISQYYRHDSGDMMADPDYQIKVSPKLKTVEVLTWQLDGMAHGYQEVYDHRGKADIRMFRQLNVAFGQWLNQLHLHQYSFVDHIEGTNRGGVIPDVEDREITRDDDGDDLTSQLSDEQKQRLIRGFEEINQWYKDCGKEPSKEHWMSIIELQLAARLEAMRKKWKDVLKEHDEYGLLAS
jgi:hypothetical protein